MNGDMVAVYMLPSHFEAYRRWLHRHHLDAMPIPREWWESDVPTFFVSLGDTHPIAAMPTAITTPEMGWKCEECEWFDWELADAERHSDEHRHSVAVAPLRSLAIPYGAKVGSSPCS
jgi:hypothetical protein